MLFEQCILSQIVFRIIIEILLLYQLITDKNNFPRRIFKNTNRSRGHSVHRFE